MYAKIHNNVDLNLISCIAKKKTRLNKLKLAP